MTENVFSAKCPRAVLHRILEKGKEITLADIFVEKVRESERAALDARKKAQLDAKELIDAARRDGEVHLLHAERDAEKRLSASAKADAAFAQELLQKEEESAKKEAAALTEQAASHMDEAVTLILQRVGGVWQ